MHNACHDMLCLVKCTVPGVPLASPSCMVRLPHARAQACTHTRSHARTRLLVEEVVRPRRACAGRVVVLARLLGAR
eukprot:364515-Chlamydomonas_euryale.AAC.6